MQFINKTSFAKPPINYATSATTGQGECILVIMSKLCMRVCVLASFVGSDKQVAVFFLHLSNLYFKDLFTAKNQYPSKLGAS